MFVCLISATVYPEANIILYVAILSDEEKLQLKDWLLSSRDNQFTPITHLRFRVPENLQRYGETALTHAVHELGFRSVIRPRKSTVQKQTNVPEFDGAKSNFV